jgi:hypothetical protein
MLLWSKAPTNHSTTSSAFYSRRSPNVLSLMLPFFMIPRLNLMQAHFNSEAFSQAIRLPLAV